MGEQIEARISQLQNEIKTLQVKLERVESYLKSEFGRDSESAGNVHRYLSGVDSKIEKIFENIYGNGQPGIKTDLHTIAQQVRVQDEKIKSLITSLDRAESQQVGKMQNYISLGSLLVAMASVVYAIVSSK